MKLRPRRVHDAITDCPACGARSWTDRPVRRRITCDGCGHAVDASGIVRITWDDGDEPDPAAAEAFEREERARMVRMLDGLGFRVYALAGAARRPELTSWGGGEDAITRVGLWQDGIGIGTEHAREWRLPLEHALPFALRAGLTEPDLPELSEPAITLLLDERRRREDELVAEAERERLDLLVDGAPAAGALLRSGEAWGAVVDHGELRITLSSHTLPAEAIELRALENPGLDINLEAAS